MKETIKFYKCSICQNIIEVIEGNMKALELALKEVTKIQ